jgi:putative flippase GtrA
MMIHKIKALGAKFIERKEMRYILSGGASEGIEYISFLILFGVFHLLYVSNSISFFLGVISGFLFHKKWSFPGEHQFKTTHQIVGYVSLALINFFLINILVGYLVYGLGLRAYIAKFLAIGIAAVWSFIFSNYLFFRSKPSSKD